MHERTITAATAALLIAFAGAAASAMPPGEFNDWKEGYTEARTKLFQSGSATRDSHAALLKVHRDKLDIASLKPSQIAEVEGMGLLQGASVEENAELFTSIQKAIEPHLNDRGSEGFAANSVRAILQVGYKVGDAEAREVMTTALTHPGLSEAMGDASRASGVSSLLYTFAYRIPKDLQAELAAHVLALRPAVEAGAAPGALMPLDPVYGVLAEHLGKTREAEVEQFRLAAMAQLDATIADESVDEAMRNNLKRVHQNLEAAPRIAKLVGSPAPELSFTWSNTDKPIASLADLRGKVVVLDFWATWCGPCVASFPNIKELQSFYEGFPVVIVGVTSPQGSVISKAKGSIKAESPEHEYELMADYIDEMDISWTIAFSSQPVFNPEYGVRGIPHVAIIDPEGVLRYRGLHPAHPMAEKVEKINGLLKEFGLPAPDDSEIVNKSAKPTG